MDGEGQRASLRQPDKTLPLDAQEQPVAGLAMIFRQQPCGLLAGLSFALVLLAALTAWFSGREATGMGPVRAVKEDW